MPDVDEYCDLCELPKFQCVHGMPPAPVAPPPAPKPARRAPRAKPTATAAPRVARRWTPPESFKPVILQVLRDAGGELAADAVFLELEVATEDQLLPGDRETTPEGEPRWQYAARRARVALIEEGLMTKRAPGVWTLTG